MIKNVAILSTGEMGHEVAKVLRRHGARVFTCLTGRSERTKRFASLSQVENIPTLQELVKKVELIISITIPSAALSLAQEIGAVMEDSESGPIFVDANSISPLTAEEIEKVLQKKRIRFVDSCIIGGASQLEKGTTFYASGPWASEFSQLKNYGLSIELLGPKNGQASAFKMVYAGLTKGLSALLTELLLLAHRKGIMGEIIGIYRKKYPEVARMAEVLLPRLPFRAARRSEEMEELAATLANEGLPPIMARATQELLRRIGNLKMRERYGEAAEESWQLADVLDLLWKELTSGDGPNGSI